MLAGWIVGAPGLIATLVYLWSRAVRVWRFGRRVADRIDEMLDLVQRVDALAARELTANGGRSMKDKLDEQCANIGALRGEFAVHVDDDVLIQGRILERLDEMAGAARD